MLMRIAEGVCFGLLATSWSVATPPGDMDIDTIKRELRQSWESLQGLEIHFKDFVIDGQGRRITGAADLDVNFAYKSRGHWAYNVRHKNLAGVENLIADVREDGKKKYLLFAFAGHPDDFDRVFIQPPTSTVDAYQGGMHPLLWLWIPGGKSPHIHLEMGGKLEVIRTPGQANLAVLTSSHKGGSLRIELDSEHEWLPNRVVLADIDEYRATKFRRDNGRWFYDGGFQTRKHLPNNISTTQHDLAVPIRSTGEERMEFEVTELRINREIPIVTFSLPKLGPGVAVADFTPGPKRARGTAKERQALERQFAPTLPDDPAPRIIASRDPVAFPWRITLLIGSATSLLAAGIMLYRRFRPLS